MRALLSVYDKAGISELATALVSHGVELISSGGTARAIAAAGLPVTELADLTGFGEMLGHRVVTLHPAVHGGILADRDDPSHQADLETFGIEPVDIVVGNLYPFGADPSTFDHATDAAAEDLIDIGGPTMLRAAAKNHRYVTVLVDPADYGAVLAELAASGATSSALRRRLARKAFAHTAAYDANIVAYFDASEQEAAESSAAAPAGRPDVLPPTLHLALERAQDLRYGENPHQQAARYRRIGQSTWWDDVSQLSGAALSYLNLFDADAAWRLAHQLGGAVNRPAVAIIKHANPCGAAVAGADGESLPDDGLAGAYQRAYDCDRRSAFGGIVACNSIVDLDTVAAMERAAQADVVIAPGFAQGVVERLVALRKSTRILQATPPLLPTLHLRPLSEGFLVQEQYSLEAKPDTWQVVTEREPTDVEWADAAMAWTVCASVTSNAIVLAKDGTAWGIGAGQQNRVESGELAASKADGRAVGGAAASDAFYPFADGVEAAADAGVAVVVQPGGSVNDADTIAAANRRGIAMVFTGERQFRH